MERRAVGGRELERGHGAGLLPFRRPRAGAIHLGAVAAAVTLAAVLDWGAVATARAAELAVSANDGKQVRPGEAGVTPDTVAVIDLSASPPRVLGQVEAPASLVGPPTSVAVSPDQRFALVVAAQKLDEAGKLVPDDRVSVIDLGRPTAPRVVQTLRAGPGASGVSIDRAGALALVASTGDDTVSVYAIADGRLTPRDRVQLQPGCRPTDVAFVPGGHAALVVCQKAGGLVRLAVDGQRVTTTGQTLPTGRAPYGLVLTPDGRATLNTNLAGAAPPRPGAGPPEGTVSMVDLATGALVQSIAVGQGPEHLTLSRDGRYLEVTIGNNSAPRPTSPAASAEPPYGLMKVYRLDGLKLSPVAETRTGRWCQGAVWSADGRRLLLQCAAEREIEAYRFDGATLTADPAATLSFSARPGAMATATSR